MEGVLNYTVAKLFYSWPQYFISSAVNAQGNVVALRNGLWNSIAVLSIWPHPECGIQTFRNVLSVTGEDESTHGRGLPKMLISWKAEYQSRSNSGSVTFLNPVWVCSVVFVTAFRKMNIDIEPVGQTLSEQIWLRIDSKTKPSGALGQLENIAAKVASIQRTLNPVLSQPTIVVVAADHGVVTEDVSAFPQEVTLQMVMNFVSGGAAINVFARQHGITLKIVDAGVDYEFLDTPEIIDLKIRRGTQNFVEAPAMSIADCERAMNNGASLIFNLHRDGCNVVGFGEMGIGNTTTAAAMLAAYSDLPADMVVGRGTGVDEAGFRRKQTAVTRALEKHGRGMPALEKLATYGGFEIATIVGAMLQAASNRMLILVDGFIVSAALLAAHAINPTVLEYCLFCHTSNERAHQLILDQLEITETILKLDMRLGEGTGAAVAYPIVASSIAFFNEMASFQDAGVSNDN